ncbi:MAG: hypothetical protein JNL08_17225 [Planctomycetes bacterium]|nr:hypothetical protein [Planctomycetota bacterium]
MFGFTDAPSVDATPTSVLMDTDGDFLPDVVEWAVMTSSTNADTDGDLSPDFVEVVQRGAPRFVDDPLPIDHEMRVVMTAPAGGAAGPTAWLHLLMRFAVDPTKFENFTVWFEPPWAPGLKVPLEGLFSSAILSQRNTTTDGIWLCASVPLVSASLLQTLLPCGIYGRALIDGRQVEAGVSLLSMQNETVCMVPFGPRGSDQFAFQSIAAATASTSTGTNRVCVVDLREVGSGPGGTVFEVSAADCVDCNELECSPSCAQSVGWLVTIPGGLATLGN